MNRIFILLLLILFSLSIRSENEQVNTYEKDTAHISSLIKNCGNLLFINPDSAYLYVDTILAISKRINYDYGLYKAYNIKGIYYWVIQDLDRAVEMYRQALIYTDTIKDARSRALIYGNMGLVFSDAFNTDSTFLYLKRNIDYSKRHKIKDLYNKSLFDLGLFNLKQDNYVEALKNLSEVKYIIEEDTDSILLIYLHSSFGVLYTKVNMFDQSLQNYLKAIELNRKISKLSIIANTYVNIGELYFRSKKDYDSAIYYYNKAIATALPYEKPIIKLKTDINKGNVFLERKNYDSAYVYYSRTINNPLIEQHPDYKAAVYVNMGIYMLIKEDYENSREFLNKGYTLSDSLELLNYTKNAVQSLYKLDSVLGKHESSLIYYKEYHQISDKIHKDDIKNNIAVLEFKKFLFEEEIKNDLLQKEIDYNNELISKQRIIIWVVFIALVILIVSVYLVFRNRLKIKNLFGQLKIKNDQLSIVNEELTVTNEFLNKQTDELLRSNKTKDKFFSILGHDLKSPFNYLLGFLSLLNSDWEVLNDEKKKELVNSLYKSSQKTYKLLEDLLNWSRVQQGLIKCKNDNFNVLTKTNEVVNLLSEQLNSKNQKLTINISSDLDIYTDPRLYMQIVQNLLNNAIKYTHENGSIDIIGEIVNNEFSLCVSDSGIGFPKDKVDGIFDLDSDFKRPGTNNEKSSGMGLILSKEYAELIDGKLSLKSEDKKGSSFCLRINV